MYIIHACMLVMHGAIEWVLTSASLNYPLLFTCKLHCFLQMGWTVNKVIGFKNAPNHSKHIRAYYTEIWATIHKMGNFHITVVISYNKQC